MAFAAALGLGAAWPCRVAHANLRDGLVGYWRLDETGIGAATVASDASGRQHHGAYVGTPTASALVPTLGYANTHSVVFTRAAHQAVRIANMPAALKPAAVTISLWYLATSTDADRSELVSAGDSYIIYLAPDGLGAGRRQVGGWSDVVAAAPGMLDGKWHHAAATIDANKLEVFFDGAAVGANPVEGPLTYDLGPDLWLGRYGFGTRARDFEGLMDEVAIYDRVLTRAEIAELASGAQPGVVVVAKPEVVDAAADGGAATDAAVDAAPEAGAPEAPPADARPETAPPVTVADAASEVSVPPAPDAVVGPPPVTVADAAAPDPDAGAPEVLPVIYTGKHRYHDVQTCAASGASRPGLPGLVVLAALLLVGGGRRRRRSSADSSR